jgi:hypothetical protein
VRTRADLRFRRTESKNLFLKGWVRERIKYDRIGERAEEVLYRDVLVAHLTACIEGEKNETLPTLKIVGIIAYIPAVKNSLVYSLTTKEMHLMKRRGRIIGL